MKNTHIQNLLTEVPKEIRIQVYKEALVIYKNPNMTIGLCLMLPVILWGLKNFFDLSPDGYTWRFEDTSIAFPELDYKAIEIIELYEKIYKQGDNFHYIRLELLNKWIKDLESDEYPE